MVCGKQREATLTYSIPGKTAALVPEFTVEDFLDGHPVPCQPQSQFIGIWKLNT